ncbi:MAG: ABC transporter substrate-binding protein, partial [Oscillospiraceae bacterium]
SLDEAEVYMDAIAKNEPTLIPLDIGSDYDKLFMFDRMWFKANWESDAKVCGIGSWQTMASVSEQDNDAAVKGNFDQPEFMGVIERLKDWKDRGFWSKNAVVNTQNNTESFQAGKSALAMCNVNTAKSIYAKMLTEHPEWDVRVSDAQEDVPPVLNSYLANGMSIFSKSRNPERALMALDYLRNDKEINSLFCYGIEGKHWKASGENGLESLPDSKNYAYDSNCNWGVRNDANWRIVEGGIPNLQELNATWEKNARSTRYQTFVFDDSNVKNEIAAITDIFNTDYKLLGMGFTDDPSGDIAKIKKKMTAAGAEKVYAEMQKQAQAFNKANES